MFIVLHTRFAREIIRSTTKLQQLAVKLTSMITSTKSLVDRRKMNEKINLVKKELKGLLETAAEICKEAGPLETLEGLAEADVKKLSAAVVKKTSASLTSLEASRVKLVEAAVANPAAVKDLQMECGTTITKLRHARTVAEAAPGKAEYATVKEAVLALSGSGVEAPGKDGVTVSDLGQLLAGVLKGGKLADDQVKRVLDYLDPESTGTISIDTWTKLTQKLYVCTAAVALTDGATIGKGCKILRQLAVDETVAAAGEPQLDDKGMMRMKVKTTKDNLDGYVTEKGNQ